MLKEINRLPFGRRLSKTVNGATTFYLYSDEGLIAETNQSGSVTKTYGWKPQGTWGTAPIWLHVVNSTTGPAGYFWFENDHLGTPQKLTTPSGAVVWSATYDAFGRATVDPASTVDNYLGLPGQYRDTETGLSWNWQRYYDPAIGRYITPDPLDLDSGSFNLYQYALGNPVTMTDPYGEAANSGQYYWVLSNKVDLPNGSECRCIWELRNTLGLIQVRPLLEVTIGALTAKDDPECTDNCDCRPPPPYQPQGGPTIGPPPAPFTVNLSTSTGTGGLNSLQGNRTP
jgi:RHS repeat-associated protein